MKPRDEPEAARLTARLRLYEDEHGPLRGLAGPGHREVLVSRILESEHRNEYFEVLRARDLSSGVGDPNNVGFDPHMAALLHLRAGRIDEACWLAFLSVHFGKHRLAGWRYVRDVYGQLGSGLWGWGRVASDVGSFRTWLEEHEGALRSPGGPHGFGNHRKYENLSGWKERGTGAAVAGYVRWTGPDATPSERLAPQNGETPSALFDRLYRSLQAVPTFGRTAAFDFLNLLRNLGVAEVEPGKAYLVGATGPRRGACLLFWGSRMCSASAAALQASLDRLEGYLGVGFDVLEDALCNWQKHPSMFTRFRG